MRIVAALLTLAVVALGQDCRPDSPCSPAAKKAAPGLSAKIAELEARAAKGCKTSDTRLAALCKVAGATDAKDLKAKVAAYEKYAPCGCDMSKKKLAELNAVLAPQPKPSLVSTRVPVLLAAVANGDVQAKAMLMQLCEVCCPPGCGKGECGKGQCGKGECGKGCGDKLVVRIQTLEASAAKGCSTSATKLAKLEAVLASLPVTSTRVAKVFASARKGDAKSQAMLKSLCAECCPPNCRDDGCAKECGEDCGEELIGRIQKLETSAAKGCSTSAAKLAGINAMLSGAAKAKKPADCTGCLPEGCPGESTKQ